MMGEWRGWRGMRGLAGDDVRVHAEGGCVGMRSGKFAGDTGYEDLQNEKAYRRKARRMGQRLGELRLAEQDMA